MKYKKALLGLFFFFLIFSVFSRSAPVHAETAEDEGYMLDYPKAGFTILLPVNADDIQGVLEKTGGGEPERGCGITVGGLEYIAMSDADYQALNEKKVVMPWDAVNLIRKTGNLFTIYGIDGGRDFSDVNAYYENILHEEYAVEIAKAGEYTYYLYEHPYVTLFGDIEEYRDAAGTDFYEEYSRLRKLIREALEKSAFFPPLPTYLDTAGKIMSFETTDMAGNPVDSGELFGSHEITIVNIWATWCAPCIRELPDLERLNKRIADYDCAVVGLLIDGDSAEAQEEAKAILKRKNVTYEVLLPPANISDFFAGGAIPATFFVNRSGEIIGDEIRGAYVEEYEKTLMAYLSGQPESTREPDVISLGNPCDPTETAKKWLHLSALPL